MFDCRALDMDGRDGKAVDGYELWRFLGDVDVHSPVDNTGFGVGGSAAVHMHAAGH